MKKTYELGEHVSMQHVADRYPGTIVGMSSTTLLVQQDRAVPAPNAAPMSNDWTIVRNPNGPVMEFTRRKNGGYAAKGSKYPFLTKGWSHYHSYEF